MNPPAIAGSEGFGPTKNSFAFFARADFLRNAARIMMLQIADPSLFSSRVNVIARRRIPGVSPVY